MNIRRAMSDDVESMAHIAELRRLHYENLQPVFWRKAENSEEVGREFFYRLIEDKSTHIFVVDSEYGVSGFIIARETKNPPVYAPGGSTYIIDDFALANPATWSVQGRALLEFIQRYAKENNWRQIVVVCADQDMKKKTMLEEAGLLIASNWYTHTVE